MRILSKKKKNCQKIKKSTIYRSGAVEAFRFELKSTSEEDLPSLTVSASALCYYYATCK